MRKNNCKKEMLSDTTEVKSTTNGLIFKDNSPVINLEEFIESSFETKLALIHYWSQKGVKPAPLSVTDEDGYRDLLEYLSFQPKRESYENELMDSTIEAALNSLSEKHDAQYFNIDAFLSLNLGQKTYIVHSWNSIDLNVVPAPLSIFKLPEYLNFLNYLVVEAHAQSVKDMTAHWEDFSINVPAFDLNKDYEIEYDIICGIPNQVELDYLAYACDCAFGFFSYPPPSETEFEPKTRRLW
jgi:hypothetical protein